MSKNLIKSIVYGVLWAIVVYLSIAFYNLSIDPIKWSETGRAMFSLFGMFMGTVIVFLTASFPNNE